MLERINDYHGKSKIFESLEDMVRCAVVDERKWFRAYQPHLLELANSAEGRDLLCVDFPHRVDRIAHNRVESWDGPHTAAEFRVGTKYGNVVRYRFEEVIAAMKAVEPAAQRRAAKMGVPFVRVGEFRKRLDFDLGLLGLGSRPAFAYYDNITRYPQAGVGGANVSCDAGVNYYNSGGASWATIYDATNGHYTEGTTTSNRIRLDGGEANPPWKNLHRVGMTIDTSSIGAGPSVTATTLTLTYVSLSGPNGSMTPSLALVSWNPAANNDIAVSDYSKFGTTQYATAIGYASWSGSMVFTFNATGRAAVSKTGITKLGLREGNYDLANSAPSFTSGTVYELNWRSADYTGTANDPALYVEYSSAAGGGFLVPGKVW
jgi:hypothetical protein